MNTLFVAWRGNDPAHGWGPVGRLQYDAGTYRFLYTKGARLLHGFRPFPQMPEWDQVYETKELFPLFANRLLSRSRQEYESYLRWSGFDAVATPDPIAILGVTEGLRQTDRVEVFPFPVPDVNGDYENKFFLHGLRWISPESSERLKQLVPGEILRMIAEPQNLSDPHAVALHAGPHLIGYVPRYLAKDVGRLLQSAQSTTRITIERLNNDAPLQQRVLCKMLARWPREFVPCQGDEFEPIPQTTLIPATI